MRTEDHVDLFAEPVEADSTPTRVDGGRPCGLTAEGWVRTTGWLQVGDHPVSSVLLAAVAGLLWALVGAAALVTEFPVAAGVMTLTIPVISGVSWWLFTTRLRPASTARNVDTCRADELEPGDTIRLHGSIGPIGQVVEVALDDDAQVVLHGGARRTWARDDVVHLAELLR